MNNTPNSLVDVQYKEALRKYAEAFNLKKNKSKSNSRATGCERLFVIYARKSTEDDKRQVQSIEDQVDHCKKFASQNGLRVVEIIREEKSAKTAGKRTQFNKMLETINTQSTYNSILAWHPDRLARNMKESGEILDMLDKGIIIDLKFPSYSFNNDAAGKMTLSILFSMAKEFSDKLSDDTIRGNKKKVREGKYIGTAKRGYYNAPNSDYFRPDQETFPIYSNAWEMYLKGKTQMEIVKYLQDNDINIDSKSMSIFFKDPFYAGFYCYGDSVVDIVSVDPKFTCMVSPGDFLLAQRMVRDNPRGWRLSSDYRPLNDFIICGDCGRIMTAGVSKGKSDRYLSLTCGNNKCKEKRRSQGIKPIANSQYYSWKKHH